MSDGAAASLVDVGSLKVAELKEELTKRNLPTNGLKKDLASRLQEALTSQETATADQTEQAEEGEEKEKEEKEAPDEVEEEHHSENVPAAEVEADAVEAVKDPAATVMEDTQVDEAPRTEEQATQPSLIARMTEEAIKESDEVPVDDEAEGEEIEMTDGIAESNGSSLQERMGAIAKGNDQDVIDLGGEPEVDLEMPGEEAASMSGLASQTNHAEVVPEPEAVKMDREEEVPLHHQGGLSPVSDTPSVLSAEQTASTKALSELNEEESKLGKPSRSIYITGLVRPLTLPSFKAKAEEFGELDGENIDNGDTIWLDGVKSHAYVTYRDEQSAVVAKAALSGSVYPPETGKVIQAFSVPQNLVKHCIAIEEKAWDIDRGRMELRARVAEEGDALIYSLHRIETSSAVVSRLDTTLPQSSRHGHNNSQRGPASGPSRGRPFRPIDRPNPTLQWGGPSNRFVDSRTYGKDRFLRDERYDRSRSQREERGPSSRADDRVREVEARIRADRERGFVNEDIMANRPPRRDFYEGDFRSRHTESDSRWSNSHQSDTRRAYGDRNSRNLSPPPKRRDYSDNNRDDRSRRDW